MQIMDDYTWQRPSQLPQHRDKHEEGERENENRTARVGHQNPTNVSSHSYFPSQIASPSSSSTKLTGCRQLDKEAWEVSRDWCCVACQARSMQHPITSFVCITIDAVIHANEDLMEWIDRRLNMTLGQQSHHSQRTNNQAGVAPPPL